jgi:DNA polymerase-3 subunit delta
LALLFPEGDLTPADIESAVLNVARYDIDALRDALRDRDVARCARTLEGLKAEGAALPLVLWSLANEARQRPAPANIRALLHAARIDRMIKGVAKGDVWDEMLQLAIRLTRMGTA